MAIPSRQIGWSTKANLLWQISKQLQYLTCVTAGGCGSTTTTTTTICTNCISADVTIGTQIWSLCNLDVTTFRNGDPIPEITDQNVWGTTYTPAWCYWNNDSAYGPTYGKLYNWYAVNDPRGLAPVGYHVPSSAEVEVLRSFVGGTYGGGHLKEAGTCHWNESNSGVDNSTGWTGLPGGGRNSITGFNILIGDNGEWWTSSDDFNFGALSYSLNTLGPEIYAPGYWNRTQGYSVRVIKD